MAYKNEKRRLPVSPANAFFYEMVSCFFSWASRREIFRQKRMTRGRARMAGSRSAMGWASCTPRMLSKRVGSSRISGRKNSPWREMARRVHRSHPTGTARPARPAGKGIPRFRVPGSGLKNEGVGVMASAPSVHKFLKMPVLRGQNKAFQEKRC